MPTSTDAPSTTTAYLLVFQDAGPAGVVDLPPEGDLRIGRREDSAVRLHGHQVSRDHARLTVFRDQVTLTDLGSANGTWVNRERINAPRVLCSGDIITMPGATLTFHAATRKPRYGEALSIGTNIDRVIELGDRHLIVADPAMLRLMERLDRLAKTDLSVLISGETGTGKELAATALHHWSSRAIRPLVALNCAALPDTLAESELFGHERGAFTGAVTTKLGILEQSDGGTVFLDEIGELSLAIQAKLLRALETKRVARLGGHGDRAIDFRIVTATNRDLVDEVKAGRFRHDLLFRIGGATVRLPPLRERRREIPILAQRFLSEACRRFRRDAMAISQQAMQRLLDFGWPGNVRELRHVMEYVAAAYSDSVVEEAHLAERLIDERPASGATAIDDFTPIEDEIRALERTRMSQALAAAHGNQTAAAELIKMPLRTFQAKAKTYRLRDKDRT